MQISLIYKNRNTKRRGTKLKAIQRKLNKTEIATEERQAKIGKMNKPKYTDKQLRVILIKLWQLKLEK